MFGLSRREPEDRSPDSQAYLAALSALKQKIQEVKQQVQDFSNDLDEEYPGEAFSSFCVLFERISQEFMDYRIVEQNEFYEIFSRSDGRKEKARKIEQAAKQVAVLFEKCARKPKTYSRVNIRSSINKLIGELKNLENRCKNGN